MTLQQLKSEYSDWLFKVRDLDGTLTTKQYNRIKWLAEQIKLKT